MLYFQAMLVSRDGEYMMTGGDKGIVEVRVITQVSQLTTHWTNIYSRSGELLTSRCSTRSPHVIQELEVWLCPMTKSKEDIQRDS